MYKIILSGRAINSIIKTIEYIAADNVFYANQVQEYLYKSINLLSDFPMLWSDIWQWYRKIIEPHYKFKIIYKVHKKNIVIVWVYREQMNWE